MSNKMLGLLGVIGGAALMAIEIRHFILGTGLSGATIDRFDEVLYTIWSLGLMAAFWGIYRLGVTGSKTWMRLIPFLAIIGLAAMAIGSIVDILGLSTPNTNPIFFIAWPLILIGTLLTAIFALISRKWAGWRKFAPLLVVLTFPVMLLVSRVIGDAGYALFGLSWVFLGYAVLTSEPTFSLQTAQA
jgi:hypothetical protein